MLGLLISGYQVFTLQALKTIIMLENKKVEVRQVDHNNKGLFAKSSLRGWETVLDCEPICVSTSIKNRTKYCSFCFLEKQVSRCSQCKVPYYCSKDCQKQDWKYHKFECPALKKIQQKNLDPSKINMEILLNLKLWIMKQKNTEIKSRISQMCHLIQFQTPNRLKQFQQTSVMLAELLSLERTEANLSQLIKQQSIISLNSFTIQDYLCNQQSIGIGLYWPANFINHHCHPNCTQVFDGRYLKIIANRQIQEKQEISISYMPVLADLKQKQKLCREGYLFECFCEECQVNKMFNQSLIHLKCPKCHNATIVDKSKKKLKQAKIEADQASEKEEITGLIQCTTCNQILQVGLLSQAIQNVNNLLVILSKPDTNYRNLKKSLIQLRKLISQNDPRIKDCINRCYLESLEEAQKDQKIYSQSYILLKEMINLYPKWYRLNPEDEIPYVFVWKYAQLGKLAYNLSKFKKACEYTQKAYQILEKVKFKNSFVQMKQLKQRNEQMKIGLSFNKAELFKGRQ